MVEIKEGMDVVLTEKFDVNKDSSWQEYWLKAGGVYEVMDDSGDKYEVWCEEESDYDYITGDGVLPVAPLEEANVAVVVKELSYDDVVLEKGQVYSIFEKSSSLYGNRDTATIAIKPSRNLVIDGLVNYSKHFAYAYDSSVDSEHTSKVEEVMETKTDSKFEEGTLVWVKGNEGGAIIDVGEFALVWHNDNSDWLPVSLINKNEDDRDNNWFAKDDLVEVSNANLNTVTGSALTREEAYDKIIEDVGLILLEEYGHPLAKEIRKHLYSPEEVEEKDTIVDDATVLSMSSKELVAKVEEWAVDRNLHTAEPSKQYLKLVEEVGETVHALSGSDIPEVLDGLGDVLVVTIILSLQLGKDTGYIATTIDNLDYLEQSFHSYFEDEEEMFLRLAKMNVSLGRVAEGLAKGKDVEKSVTQLLSDLVVLRHLTIREVLPLRKALATAYNEIKHRKGKLVDGVFIKEEDLK